MTTLPTTTAVQAPSDEQITQIATAAHAEGRLPWAGFKKDADGFYTIPLLSQSHVALVRAVLAAMQPNAAPTAAPEQAEECTTCGTLVVGVAAPGAALGDGQASYSDCTPHLHIGDSAFEDWYQNYLPSSVGHKQIARDAYAAGMGDPLALAAPGAAIAAREQEATLTQLMQVAQIECAEVREDGQPLSRADRFAARMSGNRDGLTAEWHITFNTDYGLHESEDDLSAAILAACRALAPSLADQAISAGRTPGDSVPGVSTRELVQAQTCRTALASREEVPAASSQEDAARYRALRNNSHPLSGRFDITEGNPPRHLYGEQLDAALAALSEALSPATVAQPVGERWIIARETVISDVPDSRPILGYTVFADSFTSFDTFEEASAALGELKLPLGWACMSTTQAPRPSLFAQPCHSQGCGGEGSEGVHVEAVATVVKRRHGLEWELELDWLAEGGVCALAEGTVLLIADSALTDDEGSGTVYRATLSTTKSEGPAA